MSFKIISCQDHLLKFFKNAIKNNRLAHAYIFVGQEGIGKTLFSKELAKAIFCKNSSFDACDDCNNCKRVNNDSFPDFFLTVPEENSRVIKIEQLKYLQEILYIKPIESEYKIAIIQSADRMNEEASNCLLKTLEEPPLYAIIILIVTSLDLVEETVRSRCQIVRFSPLSKDFVKNNLINRFQLNANLAEQLALISNGSLERAISLADTQVVQKKNWLINQFYKLEANDNLTFSKELFNEWHIKDLDTLEEKRGLVKELIFSFLMYYRDLLICKVGNLNIPIYHDKWNELIISKSRSLSVDTLLNILNTIKISLEYLDRNANINLLLENMITNILCLQTGNKISLLQ
ncbi:MAG TPA: DNA polymerase III subunit delta' [Candidatus Wujingus californicus]|uniref:DNA polymerase III subunit delta' n=1 Tax=Candidatus Wujingus californicus TaxID=3367618 RepID=UPI001DC229D0|nr:DNA polymerase III subunit delta' [Planctomycetota bacterium]MDO8130639.1 DNA polymerase III subunit delta' [Candidatus Brocadiales bacterium]